MHHSIKPPVPWRQIFSWAMLPVLILGLTLAAACGGEEPAAAPAPSGAEIQAAQETADQARAAAIAAQQAADEAMAMAEEARGRMQRRRLKRRRTKLRERRTKPGYDRGSPGGG